MRRYWNNDPTYIDSAERVEEILTAVGKLQWVTPDDTGRFVGPSPQVAVAQGIAKRVHVTRPSRIGWGGQLRYPDGPATAVYGLVGIEVRFDDSARTRSVHLDRGVLGAEILYVEFYRPNDPEDAQPFVPA